MPVAREGFREIGLATLVLGPAVAAGAWFYWPVAVPFAALWLWVVMFFRDPRRRRMLDAGELCAPADGVVKEVAFLPWHDAIGAPAVRISIFLSLFNAHVNRFPCAGRVRALAYRRGEFLDARKPEASRRNECNTLLLDPDPPMPGPVEVRQIAGKVARRIICHARANDHLSGGQRFGFIKFGSRTELVIPRLEETEILVDVGHKVRAGLTLVARQPVPDGSDAARHEHDTRHHTIARTQSVQDHSQRESPLRV